MPADAFALCYCANIIQSCLCAVNAFGAHCGNSGFLRILVLPFRRFCQQAFAPWPAFRPSCRWSRWLLCQTKERANEYYASVKSACRESVQGNRRSPHSCVRTLRRSLRLAARCSSRFVSLMPLVAHVLRYRLAAGTQFAFLQKARLLVRLAASLLSALCALRTHSTPRSLDRSVTPTAEKPNKKPAKRRVIKARLESGLSSPIKAKKLSSFALLLALSIHKQCE